MKQKKAQTRSREKEKTVYNGGGHATLVFPTQLFKAHPAIALKRPVYLVEDARFFTDFAFHKQKLVLHRASMRAYADRLRKQRHTVFYVEYRRASELFQQLLQNKIKTVHYVDPIDIALEKRLRGGLRSNKMKSIVYETPAFFSSGDYLKQFFAGKKAFRMRSFYIEQRLRLGILVKDGKPVGGKWSFDEENRKPIPGDHAFKTLKKRYVPRKDRYVQEAFSYVAKNFANNPGAVEKFGYPVSHAQAEKRLDDFLQNRLALFGDYQDAIFSGEPFLYHSVLSSALNIGLLTPAYVVEKAVAYAKKHKVSINSLEGFVRQIIGWREFVRAIYFLEGEKQRKSNFFKHVKKLPASFWSATTTIQPLDEAISHALTYAYAHHIERLMVLGNFMLLCEIHPDEVYRWFMELFIDAYDWVMVPNVYGMSQYADGGRMTTKPYFSGSNYIMRMSNYKRGSWADLWDALYWNFVEKNKNLFAKVGRLKIMAFYAQRMRPQILFGHMQKAQSYLKKLK